MTNEIKRRLDSLEKTYLHVVTAVAIGLLSWLATTSDTNKNESIKLNTTMTHVVKKVESIDHRVNEQSRKVGKIAVQVRLGCERSNIYWPEHKIDCSDPAD